MWYIFNKIKSLYFICHFIIRLSDISQILLGFQKYIIRNLKTVTHFQNVNFLYVHTFYNKRQIFLWTRKYDRGKWKHLYHNSFCCCYRFIYRPFTSRHIPMQFYQLIHKQLNINIILKNCIFGGFINPSSHTNKCQIFSKLIVGQLIQANGYCVLSMRICRLIHKMVIQL